MDIVYYDLDRYVIREDAKKPVLDKLAELMGRYPFLDLLVGSHTDSRAVKIQHQAVEQPCDSGDRIHGTVRDPCRAYPSGMVREQELINDCGDGVRVRSLPTS
ncbi:hypothetical protein V8V91_17765 [Algoriphagus halophilus]|uniref:hypothetical protein n=1 Tax=Algoriphagus halophilus TaxID=226505 RepID=UPI00358E078C